MTDKKQDRVQDSNSFDWIKTDQVFCCGGPDGIDYDIDMAKRIILASPRPVFLVSVSDIDEAYGIADYVDIAVERPQVDLSFPLILITVDESESPYPIDGWHRLEEALKRGVEHLPAVLLSEQEADQCEMPPVEWDDDETDEEGWAWVRDA